MKTYAVLHNPIHQRIYREAATRMAVNELTAAEDATNKRNPREKNVGGVSYILFDCDTPLTEDGIKRLSRLSFAYALYEYEEGKEGASEYEKMKEGASEYEEGKEGASGRLIPLDRNPDYLLDEGLSSMLKYTGKTNELFTRLMLNLASQLMLNLNTSPNGILQPLRVLDPLAGKGTTLYEALLPGHHAYGVEIDAKYPAEADQYLKKFLELARFKHTSHKEKVGGQTADGKKFSAVRYQIALARDKDAQKSGDVRQFEMINGDTRHIGYFYKKGFFDIIIADLPYGVQHSSKDNKKTQSGFTRNAMGLLKEALPIWLKVLKPGGVIALSWNLFLITRKEMDELFAAHGLAVPESVASLDFTHRVDQAIERDVIVGRYK
ncbi:MAG: hypothetical protein FWD90_07000 [Defluviitaleaceae bacterium]|nr:hypothetical protein [Defluviitaleaceae bacterium]